MLNPARWGPEKGKEPKYWGLGTQSTILVDCSQSLFYFVPQENESRSESHNQAGSTTFRALENEHFCQKMVQRGQVLKMPTYASKIRILCP